MSWQPGGLGYGHKLPSQAPRGIFLSSHSFPVSSELQPPNKTRYKQDYFKGVTTVQPVDKYLLRKTDNTVRNNGLVWFGLTTEAVLNYNQT